MTADAAPQTAPDNRRALVVLLFVIFLNIAGFGLVIPLLPFFGQTFQADAWQITLMFSAFSFGQFLAEPMWGRLSDRIGRRPVLTLTIAGMAISYIALAFAPNIWMACLARLMGGFLGGNIATIQGAIADITPPRERAARMGLMGAAFSAGFVAGPALGGLLAHPELGAIGYRLPLFAAAILGLASSLCVFLFVRDVVHDRPPHAKVSRKESLREAFAHPVISRVVMISCIVVTGFAGVESTYGLFTERTFGWGPREIGFAFMGIGFIGAFCQAWLNGRLVRRFGESRVLAAGLVSMCIGLTAQFFLTADWRPAIAGFVLVVLGQSICFPNISALIAQSAPPGRTGEMLGLNTSAMALGRIGGPVIAGQLFSLTTPAAPFLFTAFLTLPALWLARQIRHRVQDPA